MEITSRKWFSNHDLNFKNYNIYIYIYIKTINPFIVFPFHWGLKIRIIRPRNRTAFTRSTIRHFFWLMCTRVTYKVTWSKSKRLRWMTHEAAFRTAFPAKKGAKRHTKHLVSVSMCYSRHLDGIPKKWHFSRQLPLICMQKFQHAHWLRRCQLIPNCVESWNWMQKVKWIAESWN